MMPRLRRPVAGRTATLACALLAACPAAAPGRVGETQPQIERRVLNGGIGVRVYEQGGGAGGVAMGGARGGRGGGRGGGPPPGGAGALEARVAALEAAQGTASFPGFSMQTIYALLGEATGSDSPRTSDFAEYVYFKTDDGTMADSEPRNQNRGWRLMVYMYKNVSVIEVYRRVGAGLSELEAEQILDLNKGPAKSWRRATVRGLSGSDGWTETGSDTYLGYQHVRDDGQVRAFRSGGDLVLFSANLDQKLAEIARRLSETDGAGSRNAAASAAHSSTRGF